jgi:hypothetical protein
MQPTMRRTPLGLYLLLLFVASGMLAYYLVVFLPQIRLARAHSNLTFSYGEDLYPYWLGTRELQLHDISPYSRETTRNIQTSVWGRPLEPGSADRKDQHGFSCPLYVALLMGPTARIPFEVVWRGALLMSAAITMGSVFLWAWAAGLNLSRSALLLASAFTVTSYPVLEGLIVGQLSLPVAGFMSAAAACIQSRRLGLAGVLLALATIKPQLVFLALLLLLLWVSGEWRQRWKLLLGFGICLALLLGSAQWMLPGWFGQWLNALRSYRAYTPPPLTEHVLGSRVAVGLVVILLLWAGWLAWRWKKQELQSSRLRVLSALVLSITVVTLPMGDAVYDHVLLLPAILLLASDWHAGRSRSPARRALWGLTALVLAWPWITAWPVVVLLATATSCGKFPVLCSLPLRTAAVLPFMLLALLLLETVDLLRGEIRG